MWTYSCEGSEGSAIIKSLEKKFGKESMKCRLGLTPRFVAMRVTEEQDKLGTKNMQHTEVEWEHHCT